MILVSGHLEVDPAERDRFVAECSVAVRLARASAGCLEFAVMADPVDPARVVVLERWADDAALLAFRGSGPSEEQTTAILGADVRRWTLTDEGPA